MKLNYGGAIPISTVDWHGKVSITLFLGGCPLRCPYCQNYRILSEPNIVDAAEVEKEIKKAKPFVSSVVFSGGEPLMQASALKHLARFAKENGLLVGIHTNGFYPEHVEELIKMGLVDKYFVDVKAPPDDLVLYAKVVGSGEYDAVIAGPEEIVKRVTKTVNIIAKSKIELEIRTTVIPGLIGTPDEISRISIWVSRHLEGKDVAYVIQQGLPENAMRESLREVAPFDRYEILNLARHAHEFWDNVWIRTRDQGNERV
ncbi:MAG: anaerobic ribonucleoside-triphosphate reductase activating protein [Methanosarcinaceae archaeon]|nr:anaerobic ribonucleoside-triphosphate reductase activating protein [Methanosarcinaceae archaeon]